MSSSLLAKVVGASLLLGPLGCVAGQIAIDEDAGETGGDGDGDGDPGDGDGDPGDGDGDPDAAACIEDGRLLRPLAIIDPETQTLAIHEGGGEPLVLSAALPEGVSTPSLLADATAERVAIVSGYDEVDDAGAILRIYSRDDGELLTEGSFGFRLAGPHLDALGRVTAATAWSPDPGPAGVVVVDGEATLLPSFAPRGPLRADDWIPGTMIVSGEQDGAGFLQPFTDEYVEVTSGSSWRVVDGAIEAVIAGPTPTFVIAEPEASVELELEPFAGLDAVVVDVAGDYRLLSANLGQDLPPLLVRLEVSTHELVIVDPEPPPGLEPFDCYFQRNSVDEAGRILFELRDAGAAYVRAWDPSAAAWSKLGAPMTGVEDVDVIGSYGRVELVAGFGANTTYCMPTEWDTPPADAVSGSAVQIARIEPELALTLDVPPYFGVVSVDATERCATWTTVDQDRTILDLDDGETLSLPVAGTAIWLD